MNRWIKREEKSEGKIQKNKKCKKKKRTIKKKEKYRNTKIVIYKNTEIQK